MSEYRFRPIGVLVGFAFLLTGIAGCPEKDTQSSSSQSATAQQPTPAPEDLKKFAYQAVVYDSDSSGSGVGSGSETDGIAQGSGTDSAMPSSAASPESSSVIRGQDAFVCRFFDSIPPTETSAAVRSFLSVDMQTSDGHGTTKAMRFIINGFSITPGDLASKEYVLSQIPVPTPSDLFKFNSGDMSYSVKVAADRSGAGYSRRVYSNIYVTSDEKIGSSPPATCRIKVMVGDIDSSSQMRQLTGLFNCKNLIMRRYKNTIEFSSSRKPLFGNFKCKVNIPSAS